MKYDTPFIYPGAMHIHTTYSDGSGSIPEVIAAAHEAGLRWIIITDHDTLKGKSFEGWHDGLLVLVGHEITPTRNHYLALNVNEVINRQQPTQDFIDAVYTRGGFGIIAHPDDHEQNRATAIHPWEDWSINGPRQREGRTGGLEIWNWMSDWRSKHRLYDRHRLVDAPHTLLTGPTESLLSWWDELNTTGRRTFGTAGLDVHATLQRHPDGTRTIQTFPYLWMFRTLTNYLLLDAPLESGSTQAIQQVLKALSLGRSYMLNRMDGSAPELPLLVTRGEERWQIGDSPSLAGGALKLLASVGNEAEARLIHNGRIVARAPHMLEHTIDQPGVYRVEGRRNGRGWLFTNPLFVSPGPS